MQWFFLPRIAACSIAVFTLAAQEPARPLSPVETLGIPPRSAPTDYQAQGKAGNITIAAEFAGHTIPMSDGLLTTDRYVVVETALYGAPSEKLQMSPNDFSLRINDKKSPVPSRLYEIVAPSVKDPDWAPPESKSKSSMLSTGGGGGDQDPKKDPPKPPFELQRKWAERVKKTSMAEGERALPQAGYLYFPYAGKLSNIYSLELIYNGPAGTATLKLQP